MISKNSSNKISFEDFLSAANYLGISISSAGIVQDYVDLERFFLTATRNLRSSRIAEGFLCWVLQYGHLLSPSKVRRLILSGVDFDASVFGGVLSYISENKINQQQWKIVKRFAKKSENQRALIPGPTPNRPNHHFAKYNIIAHNYKLDKEKFLAPMGVVFKRCEELKNRALFGSVVNADIVSYLKWHPSATPYQISKATGNHKARVFKLYPNIKAAI